MLHLYSCVKCKLSVCTLCCRAFPTWHVPNAYPCEPPRLFLRCSEPEMMQLHGQLLMQVFRAGPAIPGWSKQQAVDVAGLAAHAKSLRPGDFTANCVMHATWQHTSHTSAFSLPPETWSSEALFLTCFE